jgi:hypothetical protein
MTSKYHLHIDYEHFSSLYFFIQLNYINALRRQNKEEERLRGLLCTVESQDNESKGISVFFQSNSRP